MPVVSGYLFLEDDPPRIGASPRSMTVEIRTNHQASGDEVFTVVTRMADGPPATTITRPVDPLFHHLKAMCDRLHASAETASDLPAVSATPGIQ